MIGLEAVPKQVTLLLVDDDDGDAKAVQRAFRKARIANPILRAFDGLDALSILRGGGVEPGLERPHVLLVDLNMPRMNGIDLVRELRADRQLSDSIVFMLTTSRSEEDKVAAYELNIAGYIIKATAGEDFMNLVRLLDCYWRIVELP